MPDVRASTKRSGPAERGRQSTQWPLSVPGHPPGFIIVAHGRTDYRSYIPPPRRSPLRSQVQRVNHSWCTATGARYQKRAACPQTASGSANLQKSNLACHEPKVCVKWVSEEKGKYLELFERHIHACDRVLTVSCIYVREVELLSSCEPSITRFEYIITERASGLA